MPPQTQIKTNSGKGRSREGQTLGSEWPDEHSLTELIAATRLKRGA